MAAPLFLVLRQLQRRLVAAYSDVRERNADTMSSVSEVVMGAPVVRAYDAQAPTTARVTADIRRLQHVGHPRRRAVGAAVPVGRGVLGAHHRRRRGGRRVAGPGVGADRRRAGRLPVPRVPVPRADRRVHRDPRPDPDRGGRLAAGPGRARHADRDRRARRRRGAAARAAAHRGRPRHLLLPAPPRPGRRRRGAGAGRRHLHHRAGRLGRRRGRHRVGQDHAGQAPHPPGRPDGGRGAHRRASTCATCRWRRCARRW